MTGDRLADSPVEKHELALTRSLSLDKHPAVVYLAGLSEGSRRTTFQSLQRIATLLSDGRLDVFSLDWAALRYQHTAAVRAWLAEQYKPTTANKMLSALRQVLFHAWKLGQMSAEDYHQARDVKSIKRESMACARDSLAHAPGQTRQQKHPGDKT